VNIQTGFHGADLFNGWDRQDTESVDTKASADKYGSLLHLRIKAEYPDAVIVVNWDYNVSGALAHNQETQVGAAGDHSLDVAIVNQIATDLYEDFDAWIVNG